MFGWAPNILKKIPLALCPSKHRGDVHLKDGMHAKKGINKGKVISHRTQPKICSLLVISMVLSRFIFRIKTQIWFRNSTIFNEIRFRKRIDLRHHGRRVDDRR